jgi:hypothetical protein
MALAGEQRTRGAVKTLALVAPLLAGCAEETILAARDARDASDTVERDAGDGDGDGDASERTCSRDDDCRDGEYCEKSECDAPRGRCASSAAFCGADAQPVCGCDGLTYLNECLRVQHGVNLASNGPCRDRATSCGGRDESDECREPAYCVRWFDSSCSFDGPGGGFGGGPGEFEGPGQCWIVPAQCDSAPQGGDRYRVCESGPGECLDLCNAIISGRPFARVDSCRDDNAWPP